MIRTRVLALAALGLAATAGPAAADDIVAGVVVKIDRREIYVNLGEGRGLADGADLRLKRPVALKHPVTRKPVADWLPLGTATVTATGDSLARIELPPALLAQVKVGDIAEVYVERDEAPPPPPAPKPSEPARPLPQVDPETAQVLQVWRAVNGSGLDGRIAAWEGWLAAHASSRYADSIRADLEVLRATREALEPQVQRRLRAAIAFEHDVPAAADADAPIPLAFVTGDPASTVAATLHARVAGQRTYRRIELSREHGIYLRGALPADLAVAPGVEYFVEAVHADGTSVSAFATPDRPASIDIAPPPLVARFAPTRRRTRVSIIGSYLDFANLDRRKNNGETVDRTDRFAQTEIDILYRLDGPLYGVRAGFGAYGGRGGFANRIWTETETAPVIGFQYGYAEAELRFPVRKGPAIGVAGRFYAGVGRRGFGVGGSGRVRLGDADRTNLSFAVSGVDQLGFFTELRLETWPRERLPVGISVGVTDQPGNGDVGVRLATDLGWRARPWVTPTVRVSWQGRSADHAGLGGGLGVVFDW